MHKKIQIGGRTMLNNTRCFILGNGGYEEISYAELQERRANDPAYTDKRFLRLHGMLMEVTEADYRDFYRDMRRQRYLDEEAARNGAFSCNAQDGEDCLADPSPLLDEVVPDKLLLEQLLFCFGQLAEDDRRLLSALFFDGKSERDLAKELGIPRMTLSYQKGQALDQLKRMMKI